MGSALGGFTQRPGRTKAFGLAGVRRFAQQVRDLILPGGALTFFFNRIVLMKEAALDFARRHELPPPSAKQDRHRESAPPPTWFPSFPAIRRACRERPIRWRSVVFPGAVGRPPP